MGFREQGDLQDASRSAETMFLCNSFAAFACRSGQIRFTMRADEKAQSVRSDGSIRLSAAARLFSWLSVREAFITAPPLDTGQKILLTNMATVSASPQRL